MLHGRDSRKLYFVQAILEEKYPKLSFRIIVIDAAKGGPEALYHMENVVNHLKDIHVTVLVNNVGSPSAAKRSGNLYTEVHDIDAADVDHLINLNSRFPVQFTRAAIPLLLLHGGPSLILTMGSMGEFGMPYLSIYSAAKCFDMCFSRALRREMLAEGRKVEVLGIIAGEVTGVDHDRSKGNIVRPDAKVFAEAALDRVGCGEDVVAGWWAQAIIWGVVSSMPLAMLDKTLAAGVRDNMDRRAKNT